MLAIASALLLLLGTPSWAETVTPFPAVHSLIQWSPNEIPELARDPQVNQELVEFTSGYNAALAQSFVDSVDRLRQGGQSVERILAPIYNGRDRSTLNMLQQFVGYRSPEHVWSCTLYGFFEQLEALLQKRSNRWERGNFVQQLATVFRKPDKETPFDKSVRSYLDGFYNADTVGALIQQASLCHAPASETPKATVETDDVVSIELIQSRESVQTLRANIENSILTGPASLSQLDGKADFVDRPKGRESRFQDVAASPEFLAAYWSIVPELVRKNGDRLDNAVCRKIRDVAAWGYFNYLENIMNWMDGDRKLHLYWARLRVTLDMIEDIQTSNMGYQLHDCRTALAYVSRIWNRSLRFRPYKQQWGSFWRFKSSDEYQNFHYFAWADPNQPPIAVEVTMKRSKGYVDLGDEISLPEGWDMRPSYWDKG